MPNSRSPGSHKSRHCVHNPKRDDADPFLFSSVSRYWLAVPVSHSSIKIASAGKRMKRSASFAPGAAVEDEEGNLFDDVGMGLGEVGEHEHALGKRGGVVGTVYLIACRFQKFVPYAVPGFDIDFSLLL
jgi:hypothetical protein